MFKISALQTIIFLCFCPFAQAQIIPDGTTNTIVTTTDNLKFSINSISSGANLFHSFNQFSIPINSSVTFVVSSKVENIFSRVTGEDISVINGNLSILGGSTNLFFLNPNGIIFGSNASLNLGGSFLATTADRFIFQDGNVFSATDLESQFLLTQNIPIGLEFGANPGRIINRSIVQDSFNFRIGLNVQGGKTIGLLGGDIVLQGGIISAPGGVARVFSPGGNIEIGSVGANSFVSLSPNNFGFALDLTEVQSFQDIELSTGTLLDSGGNSNGKIILQGRNISIDNGSQLAALNFGNGLGQSIILNSSESLKIANTSSINTINFFNGIAGDIEINTNHLSISRESFIDANQSFGSGLGGNIKINATEINISDLSFITAQTFGSGNAGNITLNTNQLNLTNGGQIVSTSQASGNGGQIHINATDTITLNGSEIQPLIGRLDRSGILSEATGTGTAGEIVLSTQDLSIANEAIISTQATSGNGGNIDLNLNRLLILNNGNISATAGSSSFPGNGGNISIDTPLLIALPNSSNTITANAFTGTGGNIIINTSALLGSQFLNISASSAFGLDGQISLQQERHDIDNLQEFSLTLQPLPTITQSCLPGGKGQFTTIDNNVPPTLAQRLILDPIWFDLQPALQEAVKLTLDNGEIVLAGTGAQDLIEQGQHAYQQGRFREAAIQFEQASQRGEHRAIALLYLTVAYQQQGQWQAANQTIAQALGLRLSPEVKAEALRIKANGLIGIGELETAIVSENCCKPRMNISFRSRIASCVRCIVQDIYLG